MQKRPIRPKKNSNHKIQPSNQKKVIQEITLGFNGEVKEIRRPSSFPDEVSFGCGTSIPPDALNKKKKEATTTTKKKMGGKNHLSFESSHIRIGARSSNENSLKRSLFLFGRCCLLRLRFSQRQSRNRHRIATFASSNT
jgi:hypothetical protein